MELSQEQQQARNADIKNSGAACLKIASEAGLTLGETLYLFMMLSSFMTDVIKDSGLSESEVLRN